ncbi:arylesterase [Aurantimonas sp. VKM B-3413]|uniref:arylesterase n=1 Tax=Aurantimonas sp. VKM B-3413 TaxID=2779401 RepID=UPI00351D0563
MLTFLSWLGFCAAAAAQTASGGTASGPPPADDRLEIVAFGDSLTQGYGVGPGEAFPEQLQAALRQNGYDVTVTNAGVSGDTTTGGLARLEWSVPANADLVIVELGANDALRGVSPGIVRDNLDAILGKLTGRGQAVILAGMMAPPNMGADYAKTFDAIFPELAEKYGVAFYPFFLEGVAAQQDLNQADAMHPNPEGVAVIVKKILPLIEKTLDTVKAG